MTLARFILLAGFGLALTLPVRGQGEVLMREVVSREYGINVGAVQDPAIKSLVSREVGIFVGEEPAPPYRQVVSREVSLAVADESAPPRIEEIAVTVSPTGNTVTLDWSGYNQWQVRDVKHYAVYYSTSPIGSVAGTPYQIVPGEQLSVTLAGLVEWQDHFFAVVPVDAMDHFDPVVNYAAAYVLMPEVVSREVGLFIGVEPDPPYRQAVSREVSLVVADPAPPPRITDFTVTASPTGSSVTLNWSSYNQFAVRDVARYDIYYSTSAFTDITGMTPYATVGGEIFQWSQNGLPEWQDHFFAVVPVDGMGNKDPQVLYSAAYVLMGQVVSREVGLFNGAEPAPPYREVVSREVSLVVADDTVPAPVTGPTSGFLANTAVSVYGAVTLDWSDYPIWTQRDVVRYRIYSADAFFDHVNAPGVVFHGFSQDGTATATIDGLPPETILYFAVVAEDSSGQFDPSVYAVSAKTSVGQLGDVANLAAARNMQKIKYTWDLGGVGDELAGFVREFRVYFDGSGTPLVLYKSLRSWTATGLTPGTSHTLRVTTVDTYGLESSGAVLQASTHAEPQPVAYWRFEEGTAGQNVPDSSQNTVSVDPVLDSSPSGNVLRTYNAASAPLYWASVGIPVVPRTGAKNALCLDFSPNDDLYEFGTMIQNHPFQEYTIEASVALDSLNGWRAIICRDGNAAGSAPAFRMMVRGDNNRFMVAMVDDTGVLREIQSTTAAVTGRWYHLIASFDGTNLSFYLRGPDDPAPVLQGTLATGGGFKKTNGWAIGRGWWNGNADWFDGRIDEVRVCDEAIPASFFLQSPAPAEFAADSDGDGFGDGIEAAAFANPTDAGSMPTAMFSGLAGWWRFDGDSATAVIDQTRFGRHGSLSGGSSHASGLIGTAISLDGVDDEMDLGVNASLIGTTDFTIGMWIKIPMGTASPMYLLSQREPGTTGYEGNYMVQVNTSGILNFSLYNGGYQFNLSSSVALNDGQWHHLALQRQGAAGRIFIDGSLNASAAGTVKSLVSHRVALGFNSRIGGSYFKGAVDDLRIYSRSLSAGEVLSLANRPPLANPLNLAVTENQPAGASVGSAATTDPDSGQVLAYRITAGNEVGAFALDPATGALSTTRPLDRETTAAYSLTIEAADNSDNRLATAYAVAISITDVPADDSDADGIDDEWEIAWFQNPAACDPNADPDNDGQNNLFEFLADTIPTGADGIFPMTVAVVGANFTIQCNGVPGRRYGLQRSVNLATGTWEEVAAAGPVAAYGPVVLSDPMPPERPKAFYRIAITKP
ncbi:MAG: cadherin domain-containing protein [Verrucomicrobia bacterium]|nr:cadherin domain-containing protein [Verrucomicrobiota bacterium]